MTQANDACSNGWGIMVRRTEKRQSSGAATSKDDLIIYHAGPLFQVENPKKEEKPPESGVFLRNAPQDKGAGKAVGDFFGNTPEKSPFRS